MKNRPLTRVNLDKAIARLTKEDPRLNVDIRMSMANAIVWTNELIAKIDAAGK